MDFRNANIRQVMPGMATVKHVDGLGYLRWL